MAKEQPIQESSSVTGAGGGEIGKGYCRNKLAQEGCQCVLTDIAEDRIKRAVDLIKPDTASYCRVMLLR